jgi:hypothetical protein
VKFDQMGKVKRPFQILSGGYQIVFKNGKWSQVFGSRAKEQAFKQEDRRQHRSEQRKLGTLRPAELAVIHKAEAQEKKRLAMEMSKANELQRVVGRKRMRSANIPVHIPPMRRSNGHAGHGSVTH